MVADALSKKNMLLTKLDVQVSGLESLKPLYAEDNEFSMPYAKCSDVKAWAKYTYMMDFCFELINYVFPSVICVYVIT